MHSFGVAVIVCGMVLIAALAFSARPVANTTSPSAPAVAAKAASVPPILSGSDAVAADFAATEPARAAAVVFAIPVRGGVLPTAPELLPNSPRFYRGGVHEGIDFPIPVGAPVYAAAPGFVSRIDYAYQEWSEPARNAALDNARRLGYTPELVLDLIRGRQVWVDHGDGTVTRYAHLSAVAELKRGDPVDPTVVVGLVGSSGYPEGGAHLHFEIRTGDAYLGKGSDAAAVRQAVARAFGR